MTHEEQSRSVFTATKTIIDNIVLSENINSCAKSPFTRNKMFVATLVLTFVVSHIVAEIPPYIHVCGRRDPNLDECIIKNIDNLKRKICEGIPELKVPSSNPMYLKKITVVDTNSLKLIVTDVYVTGLCDYDINSFHMNLEKLHYDLTVTFKRINLSEMYDLNVKVIAPITLEGSLNLTTENLSAKMGVDLKTTIRDGKQYVSLSNIDLDLDIKGYDVDVISSTDEELNQLRQMVTNFLGKSQKEIIDVFKPVAEKVVTKQMFNFAGQIVEHFTYDEMFPDRA